MKGQKTITSVACGDKFNNKSNSNAVGEKTGYDNYTLYSRYLVYIICELGTTHED